MNKECLGPYSGGVKTGDIYMSTDIAPKKYLSTIMQNVYRPLEIEGILDL
jgi:hypothetical protein